jgi:hypothetical protein
MKFRKPLAGLVFTLALGASIATSQAFPEWSAESESEALVLADFVQPQVVRLALDGELGEGVGYYGTELTLEVRAAVLEQVDEDETDTGDLDTGGEDTAAEDTGDDEDPGEELAALSLQLELSSESLGEEPVVYDVPLSVDLDGPATTLPWALVLPCGEQDLSLCSDDVTAQLVLSRPLEDGESIEGDLVVKGRASGPVHGEGATFPDVVLTLSVEPAGE